jgi:N-acetylglutamate synthase
MRRRPDTVRAYRDAFAERDRIYELEALVARAWPALTVLDLDGWRLRSSRGFTRRGNSVWPRASGDRLDLATKLANVERHYAARGLAAVFQIGPAPEPKGLDRVLAERGYRASEPVEVRTARIEDLPGSGQPPPRGFSVLDEPHRRWLAVWAQGGARGAQTDLAVRILSRAPEPSAYAVLRVDGADVAVGRGILDGGWLGIADVVTTPAWRGRGAARLLLAGLASWGSARGAELAWLAVEAGNRAALTLYRAAGFRRAFSYRYRTLTAGARSAGPVRRG